LRLAAPNLSSQCWRVWLSVPPTLAPPERRRATFPTASYSVTSTSTKSGVCSYWWRENAPGVCIWVLGVQHVRDRVFHFSRIEIFEFIQFQCKNIRCQFLSFFMVLTFRLLPMPSHHIHHIIPAMSTPQQASKSSTPISTPRQSYVMSTRTTPIRKRTGKTLEPGQNNRHRCKNRPIVQSATLPLESVV
jgi:hypothetical protein